MPESRVGKGEATSTLAEWGSTPAVVEHVNVAAAQTELGCVDLRFGAATPVTMLPQTLAPYRVPYSGPCPPSGGTQVMIW